jgi:glycosyltransferase involved in cell wall biosynthesis
VNEYDKKKLQEKLKISEDDFIISYLGSLGTWYMLDEMLDFFSCVLEQFDTAKFLFITTDSEKDIVEKAQARGIRKDRLIICAASRKEVPLYLSLSALSIYFIRPTYSKKASSPTKTAEILGLGIPIVTNSGIGDSTELLEKSGIGLLVTDFSKETYTAIIKQFCLLLSVDKSRMIEASRQHFSLEKGVELYQSIYNKIK